MKRSDMVLFSLCMICSIYGLIAIGSATKAYESGSFKFLFVQIFGILVGVFLFILSNLFRPENKEKKENDAPSSAEEK